MIWRNPYRFASARTLLITTLFSATSLSLPAQTFTPLLSFNGTDGGNPKANLIQATDGNFYGTTNTGGAHSNGAVFKITHGGTLTTLYSVCSLSACTDGANPEAGLIQATDGNFYGTTQSAPSSE
jgi:uncharacterized repeat protein (TIGR03803 family)